MSPSPRRGFSFPNSFGPPIERDPNVPMRNPTTNLPSPPQKESQGRDLPPATSPIPIPQPPPSTQHPESYMSSRPDWARSNPLSYMVPPGRPNSERNRRGLTVNVDTGRPNPFLSARPLSSSPPKSISRMTTPAQSPTTPNRRMIFPMELRRERSVERARGSSRMRQGTFAEDPLTREDGEEFGQEEGLMMRGFGGRRRDVGERIEKGGEEEGEKHEK